MKKLALVLALVGMAGWALADVAPLPPPVTTYSYQITPDGHVQIITTVTQPNGAFNKIATPPMGKAQATSQLNQIVTMQSTFSGQVANLNAAIADTELTQP